MKLTFLTHPSLRFAFFLSLLFHGTVLAFFFKTSSYKPPENRLAQGISNLEVNLVEVDELHADTPKEKEIYSKTKTEKALLSNSEHIPQKKSSSSIAKEATSQPLHTAATNTAAQQASQGMIGAFNVAPNYLHNPQPIYPERERRSGHQGTVLLRVAVSEIGTITHVLLEHSSNYPLLDQKALDTVASSWLFRPATKNNKNISSEVIIPIHFSLREFL